MKKKTTFKQYENLHDRPRTICVQTLNKSQSSFVVLTVMNGNLKSSCKINSYA